MNEIRFRCLIDDALYNIAPFEAHAEKGTAKSGLMLIAFDENELDKIRKLLRENIRDGYASLSEKTQLQGSDGYLYILSQTSIEKKEKMPQSIMRAFRYYNKYKKKENKSKQWIKEHSEAQAGGLIKLHGGKFSAYKYNDKENEMCFPLRLRTSKEKNKPLFILFHGAGALGNDNIKQLFDNVPLYRQLKNEDCNILLPQAPFGSNRGYGSVKRYIKSVKKLIDELPIDFDTSRIYIAGTSFGGFCVWHLAYLYPDCFAAAVPVMGGLSFDYDFEKYDARTLAKTPFWVAHAADDTNVKIDSDDYFVAELEKLGADVKYTRLDKGGHSIYRKFYKSEKWAQWCLGKRSE